MSARRTVSIRWRTATSSLWMVVALASAALAQPSAPPAPPAPPAVPAAPAAAPGIGPRVTLDMPDASVREVLDAITEQTGLSLVLTNPEIADEHQVALKVKDMPIDDLLPTLAEQAGLTIEHRGNALFVSGGAPGKHRGRHRATAKVEHAPGGPERSFKITIGDDGKPDAKGNIHIDIEPNERTSMGSDALVDVGQTVSEATAVGGSLTVRGHVEGDAVAVGGWVTLEPGAIVDGDAVAVGGSVRAASGSVISGDAVSVGGMVDADDGAVIEGDRVQVGGRLGNVILGVIGVAHGAPFVFRVSMWLLRVALFVGAGVLLAAYAPVRIENVRGFLTRRPGRSALGGLGLVVGIAPLCFVLLVTVIGIPLVPLAITAFAFLYLVGATAVASILGERIPVLADRKGPVVTVLLGLALLAIVNAVPYLGSLAVLLVVTVAAGAALLSKFGQPVVIPPVPAAPPSPTTAPSVATSTDEGEVR